MTADAGKKAEGRTEDFKRATAGALRAIARERDVQVTFQAGKEAVAGKRARLPLPTRALPATEIARLRGAADSLALRLRHHDPATHAERNPTPRDARDAYDAIEEARVEVVGARHMQGVAANLRTRLVQGCEQDGYDRMTRKEQLPVAAALGLLVRERLSGVSVPPQVERVMRLWRDGLDDKARAALAELAECQDDQNRFARASRRLLATLNIAEAETDSEGEDGDPSNDDGQGEGEAASLDASQPEEGTQESDPDSQVGAQPAGEDPGETEQEGEEGDDDEPGTMEGEDRPGGPPPRRDRSEPGEGVPYTAFARQFDEEIRAEDLCDADELARLRQQLDQQLLSLKGIVSKLANRLQRRLMAQQMRAWEFDLEEGMLDAGRLARVVANPTVPLSYKWSRC